MAVIPDLPAQLGVKNFSDIAFTLLGLSVALVSCRSISFS
jgi:hypothetical protein